MKNKLGYLYQNNGVEGRKRREWTLSDWLIAICFPILCALVLGAAIFWLLLVTPSAAGEVLTPLPPLCTHADIVCPGEVNPPIKQVKYETVYLTHYTKADCTNEKCLTAKGSKAREGGVACAKNIPLGTEIIIGDKRYSCEDRYAKWVDDIRDFPTIDIFTNETTQEALAFGIKKATVEIIEP